MSQPAPPPEPRVFAALGDPTRLRILERLRAVEDLSISELTEGTDLTRQAVTRHLEVLAEAGLVTDVRSGRERRWACRPEPLAAIAAWAEDYRRQWEQRFDRLEAWLQAQHPPKP